MSNVFPRLGVQWLTTSSIRFGALAVVGFCRDRMRLVSQIQ
jgi:hypothetical protein